MQTYSHLILTAVLRRKLREGGTDSDPALLLGSVAPDVPLILLTAGYIVHRRWINPSLPDKTKCSPTYNDLYFNNRWWILAHHLFHAPFLLLLYALIGDWGRKRGYKWGNPLFWLAVGAALHVGLDIFTHHDDGPLLLYPFDSKTRYHAPISYWDASKGGRVFSVLEHALDLYLVYDEVRNGDY
ncbi:MAG: zinc dependent phospholipase C family protein [Candidatus Promineifilaceae bacterium]